MSRSPVRALLERAVDYAGLFPPAGLSMQRAVANYAEYLSGSHAWMLARFVVPAARLTEFATCWAALPDSACSRDPELSILIGADHDADTARVRDFLDEEDEIAKVCTMEVRASTAEQVKAVTRISEELPEIFIVYVEVPFGSPTALFKQIASYGFNAKMRTGGITADAFPSPEQVVGFMRECVSASLPFKATAGLHHPVGGEYRLTYEPGAPCGCMFGFLNVFLAAASLTMKATDAEALAVLTETDRSAFSVEGDALRWRDVRFTSETLAKLRARVAGAFGSCSFTEPVNELRDLGLLP